jgi:hypothetical protein
VLIGFLTLLCYQIIGFFTFIEIEHYLIRKEIKRAIKQAVPENQLIHFHFTPKERQKLNWVKPHEFRLNGRFYDVVHKKRINGVWHFKCIDDIQETVLFEKLAFATAANLVNSPDQHPVHGWIKLINEPMEPVQILKPLLIEINAFQFQNYFYQSPNLKHPFSLVLGPPPKNIA